MKPLVVGGDSLIGSTLVDMLAASGIDCAATTRRPGTIAPPTRPYLDLLSPPRYLPPCDVAFLCAGVKGFRECEGDADSYRANVDGVLAIGKRLIWDSVFVIYVSTSAVEWSDNAYARQRALVEIGLQGFGWPAIVRAEKFTRETVPQLARLLIDIAQEKRDGIHRWIETPLETEWQAMVRKRLDDHMRGAAA